MLRFLSPVDLRRAVLGHLVGAGSPVPLQDVCDTLRPEFGLLADPKRVSDVLRYQARLGRVRRVRRGVYEYVPGSVSRATLWRCRNWRSEKERQHERWLRDHAHEP
jgi:hypothetical protein